MQFLASEQTVEQILQALDAQFSQADLYYGHGTDNAWDEALQLVLTVMQLPLDSGEEILALCPSPAQCQQIGEIATARIASRKPLAYLTHQAWFGGLPFYVDERVLIPRSPFAEWILRGFRPWIATETVNRILEIGTGSGCMAILAAQVLPEARLVAADISPAALQVAQINRDRYGLAVRLQLIESDGFANIPAQKFDVIMSNPPYVGDAEMQSLPAEYQHEPDMALRADNNGLAIVESLLANAVNYLSPEGILMVEVGNSDVLLQQTYPQLPFTWLAQDNGGHGVFVLTAQQLRDNEARHGRQ